MEGWRWGLERRARRGAARQAGGRISWLVLLGGLAAGLIATTAVARSQAPSSGSTSAAAASSPVIAAAGDIACDPAFTGFNGGLGTSRSCRQKYTSDLLVATPLAAVLPLGDDQYECGGYAAFQQSYDLSWGRVKGITFPATGNHEYQTSGDSLPGTDCDASGKASGYFRYFGAVAGDPAKGYYSYDIGSWHLIALNSNCSAVGGCGAGSPQETWLKADLGAHPSLCTLAYWHHPRFSSSGDNQRSAAFWQDLYTERADVVLVAHKHNYERFMPQDPNGTPDSIDGIREFVVGTGGRSHRGFSLTIRPTSEVRNDDTFGVLELTLNATGYDWKFVPEAGNTFTDSGSDSCH